jgi:hypothetical protein
MAKPTIRVCLLHWNAAELQQKVAALRAAGFAATGVARGDQLSQLVTDPLPDVYVIDLSRLPSHGRETADYLMQKKTTRAIPLLFAGGAAEKVKILHARFPTALFTSWDGIPDAIRLVTSRGRRPSPAVATSRVVAAGAGYSGTPLPKKLGIAEGSIVALFNAPEGFVKLLSPLPEDVVIRHSPRRPADVAVLFARNRNALDGALQRLAAALKTGQSLWVAWPKKASGLVTDLTEGNVRELALKNGVVDNKVCAIDTTWSGLRFQRRRAK